MNDPIVEEVRHHRAEIAARNGDDLRRIFTDARTREGSDGREVVSYDLPAEGPSSIVREEPPSR